MKRIEAILKNRRFQYGLQRIEQLEIKRIFCRHGLDHLLAVARIAWIIVLEQQLPLQKEIVYGAALLHDIGRYCQYEEDIPHHKASAELAAEILPEAGYNREEVQQICHAIWWHGQDTKQCGSKLAQVLYFADKRSRNCFQCNARAHCKWDTEKQNETVQY